MKKSSKNVLLTVLVLLSICSQSSAIKCYKCDSDQEGPCAGSASQLQQKRVEIVDCPSYCTVQYSANSQRTVRACDAKTFRPLPLGSKFTGLCLESEENDDMKIKVCTCNDRDLCNSSLRDYPSTILLLAAILVYYKLLNN